MIAGIPSNNGKTRLSAYTVVSTKYTGLATETQIKRGEVKKCTQEKCMY
jgi:hypothetical protein